jgi:peptidyl-prolyl cis-trans isomerase D
MFSFFRRGATAKVMLIFLGLALFAMVITGFGTGGGGLGDIGGGGTGGALVRVGDQELTDRELRRDLDDRLAAARQQNPELDLQGLLQALPFDQVVNQLVNVLAVVEYGKDRGLTMSETMFQKVLASLPEFQNLAGQFDREAYLRALQASNRTEADLRRDIERWHLQRQLVLPVQSSPHVPRGIALQYASLLLETRTGTVGAVPTGAMGPGQEPSAADLQAFYQKNLARYTIPERRVLRYAVFGREQVAGAVKPTDAEIEAAYKQNSAAYGPKETRRLSQVVLPDQGAATAFVHKVNGGTAFAQAAAQAQFSAADIAVPEQSKESYARTANAAVANAVFGAAKGAVVGPVKGPIGWHVVRIEDVKVTPARPLAAVRAEIAATLEQQKAQTALQDLASRIDSAVADGQSFEEVAQREKLTVLETPPLTGAGAAPGNPGWQMTPEAAPLLRSAFELEPNSEPVVETIAPNERFALLTVGNVLPAAAPPLAQIAPQVKADLQRQRASDRARAVAASIVSKINAGTPPAQAFAEAQVKLPPVQPVTAVRRDIARSPNVAPPLVMLFSLPQGKARLVPGGNGNGWFVVYLQKIVPGDASKDPAMIDGIRGSFTNIIGEEYAAQFANAARQKVDVKRNEKALGALKRELGGRQAQ